MLGNADLHAGARKSIGCPANGQPAQTAPTATDLVLMVTQHAAGARCRGEIRRILRARPRRSRPSAGPIGRPSQTWRRSTVRRAASSPSTSETLQLPRALGSAREPRSRSALVERLRQGAAPLARANGTPDPMFTDSVVELDLGDCRTQHRRTQTAARQDPGLRLHAGLRQHAWSRASPIVGGADSGRVPIAGDRATPLRHGGGGDRRDHELHQHVESERAMVGGRTVGQATARSHAVSRRQAVGKDQPGPWKLQGRHRLPRLKADLHHSI